MHWHTGRVERARRTLDHVPAKSLPSEDRQHLHRTLDDLLAAETKYEQSMKDLRSLVSAAEYEVYAHADSLFQQALTSACLEVTQAARAKDSSTRLQSLDKASLLTAALLSTAQVRFDRVASARHERDLDEGAAFMENPPSTPPVAVQVHVASRQAQQTANIFRPLL